MKVTQSHTHHPEIYAPEAARIYDESRAELISLFRAGGAKDEWERNERTLNRHLDPVKLLEREITELGQYIVEHYAPSFANTPTEWLIRLDTLCMLYCRVVGNTSFLNPFVLMAGSQDNRHFEAFSDWKAITSGRDRVLTAFIGRDMIACKQRVRIPILPGHKGVSLKRVMWQNLPITLSSRKQYSIDRSMEPDLVHPDLLGGLEVRLYVGDLNAKQVEGRMPKVVLSRR